MADISAGQPNGLDERLFIGRVAGIYRELLIAIGENPDRPGLADTPARAARFWREFMLYKEGNDETTFEVETIDQMVVVQGMRVWSLCEHHLLPFYCDVTIGAITGERVLGLSKFARIAHKHAHRLQLQERLAADIAADVVKLAQTPNVAVYASGVHTCAIMRGIRTPLTMKTSVMLGSFRESPATRAEFLKVISSP